MVNYSILHVHTAVYTRISLRILYPSIIVIAFRLYKIIHTYTIEYIVYGTY